MIVEHQGLPRYVNPLGIFSIPYLFIMPLFVLGDILVFISIGAWLIISIILVVAFYGWFHYSYIASSKIITRYVSPRNKFAKQFSFFLIFPLPSSSMSYAATHIQVLSVIAALVLAVKGAWFCIIWCVIRFWIVGTWAGYLNPTFLTSTAEGASNILALLSDVQNKLHSPPDVVEEQRPAPPGWPPEKATQPSEQVSDVETQWFYAIGRKRCGPVPKSDLNERLRSKKLPANTLVWRPGLATWARANSIDDFASFVNHAENRMNNRRIMVIFGFVTGAVLAACAVYFFLRPAHPPIQTLQCQVEPNEFISITNFETKILDTDTKWRCDVKNISTVALRYCLKVELTDKDSFVLATAVVDSNYGEGDLLPGKSQTIHGDIALNFSRAECLSFARITPKALKTDNDMQQEQQAHLAQRMAEIDQQAQLARAEQQEKIAEQQERINEAREKWKNLRQGMTKDEVEALLGKPSAVTSYSMLGDFWQYSEVGSFFSGPQVSFDTKGCVTGWQAP